MPVLRAVDANGAPMAGAQLQFFLTGTTTPATVYSSAALTVALANPVTADSGGLFVPIWLDPTVTYRVQLLSNVGTVIRDIDPVFAPVTVATNSITSAMLQSGVAVANIGYTPLNKAGDTATNLLLSFSTLSTTSAGYLGAPVNEQDANYTLALLDAGKMVRANITGATAYTVPPNVWPVGTGILIRNAASSSGTLTITRGSGVSVYGAGSTTTKDWAMAAGGFATLFQEAANVWAISGSGLS